MNHVGMVSMDTLKGFDYLLGRQYDLIEVCAPWDSNLGKEVERQGGSCLRMGVHNGFDLSTKAGFQKAAKVIRETRPRLIHLSPACFPWTRLQNLNQRTDEQREALQAKRVLSRKILKNLRRLAEIQIYELGGHVGGEQPWSALTWEEQSWAKIAKMAGGRFRVDGCRYGLRHPKNHKLLQKGWGFFCTHFGIQKAIQRTCNHPSYMHAHVEGNVTALTAEYPPLLCKHFVTALLNRQSEFAGLCKSIEVAGEIMSEMHNPEDCARVLANGEPVQAEAMEPGLELPSDDVAEENAEAQQPQNVEAEPDVLTPEQMNKLRVIHRNLGHPHASVLHKMLAEAGVAPKFLKAALELECDVCKKHAPKKPALPATPNVPTVKWSVVSVDTFWWKHPKKNPDGTERYAIGISFMDEATDFHVACVVRE